MLLRQLPILGLLFASISSHAALHPNWFYPFISDNFAPWSEREFSQSQEWFECSESEQVLYCSDEVSLYSAKIFGQWDGEENTLSIEGAFSLNAFNQMQLGLRADGFQLIEIDLGTENYKVTEQLTRKSAEQVDKEVLSLIGRYSAIYPRTLVWLNAESNALAIWQSDNKTIQITFQNK
ncbi:hypothetical protein [Vibrio ishigakensis]|uniref:hypothetical protein n=1 Tax=Vibrio ishigakensis TaxID=1481914 RepID=UPI0021C2E23A|nr:hypothetical protein [Vibrio ishigakensis]